MNSILIKYKSDGFRITFQRKKIIEVLSYHPQTVAEVIKALKRKNINLDRTTVYRNMDFLVDMGVIAKIRLSDNSYSYELIDKSTHHHHMVCDKCGAIQDIKINEKFLYSNLISESGFKVSRHTLEFFGLCKSCNK